MNFVSFNACGCEENVIASNSFAILNSTTLWEGESFVLIINFSQFILLHVLLYWMLFPCNGVSDTCLRGQLLSCCAAPTLGFCSFTSMPASSPKGDTREEAKEGASESPTSEGFLWWVMSWLVHYGVTGVARSDCWKY